MKIKSLSFCILISCVPLQAQQTSQPVTSQQKAPVTKSLPKQSQHKNNKKLQSPWNQVAQAIMSNNTKQAIEKIYTYQKSLNFNKGNSINNTLLMLAAYHQNTPVIQLLLSLRNKSNRPVVNINKANKFGNTPLIVAVQKGNLEIVQILLDNNANKKLKNKFGHDALFYAQGLNNPKDGSTKTPNKQKIINLLKPQEESFLEKIENLL